jgi:hypothetical protein
VLSALACVADMYRRLEGVSGQYSADISRERQRDHRRRVPLFAGVTAVTYRSGDQTDV